MIAYIDPGSGSVLLQLLFGGVAGVTVVIRLAWSRLRGAPEPDLRDHQGADEPEQR